jgi:hypothetical protein
MRPPSRRELIQRLLALDSEIEQLMLGVAPGCVGQLAESIGRTVRNHVDVVLTEQIHDIVIFLAEMRVLRRHLRCGTGQGPCDDGGHANPAAMCCGDLLDLADRLGIQ